MIPGLGCDLEPAVTTEEAEPAAANETADGEETLMSYGMTAPVAPGPVTAVITVPAAPIIDPITAPIPPTTAAGPTAALPLILAASPVAALPPLPTRPIPATGLRSRPTAEGVVLQRTLVPTPLVRPGLDSVRTTSPRARPTAPAPLAVAQPIHPLDDERSLDPVVLAYLAREIRPRTG